MSSGSIPPSPPAGVAAESPAGAGTAKPAPIDGALRKQVEEYVRRRVPAAEVDDVVQTVMLEAVAASSAPTDPSEFRRWVFGIARHKVQDLYRRMQRELSAEPDDLDAKPAPSDRGGASAETRQLYQWAEQHAGSSRDGQETLEWMAREAEGEKLETIADEHRVPAARVRKRVSRMRKWMREQWRAELVAAGVVLGAFVLFFSLREPHHDQPLDVTPDRTQARERRPAPPEPALSANPLERAPALPAGTLAESPSPSSAPSASAAASGATSEIPLDQMAKSNAPTPKVAPKTKAAPKPSKPAPPAMKKASSNSVDSLDLKKNGFEFDSKK